MTDIGTAVSLIVAATELKAVQSIRKAVRANLIARGGIDGPLGTVHMPHGRVPLPEREHGTQFLEQPSRPSAAVCHRLDSVVRTETIVKHVSAVPAVDRIDIVDCEPRPHIRSGPLVPPWRMPLTPEMSCDCVDVKSPPPPPDVMNKGSLIDFFI